MSHSQVEIQAAVEALEAGDPIVMPTETVYGLAVDATNTAAVKRIYQLKKRPANSPLSIQVANKEDIWQYCLKPPAAEAIVRKFMPGPLTLILEKKERTGLSPLINQVSNTVGVRIPDHRLAIKLLKAFGKPLVVPSANMSGKMPAITVDQARQAFGDEVEVYLDGGRCEIALASTVVEVTRGMIKVLREGSITEQQIMSLF